MKEQNICLRIVTQFLNEKVNISRVSGLLVVMVHQLSLVPSLKCSFETKKTVSFPADDVIIISDMYYKLFMHI
jgi:hypothetical protein